MLAAILRTLGLGAILTALSEVWFYPVRDVNLAVLSVYYGVIAYTAWLVCARFGLRTWAGAWWGACLFGFMIEGIPVPVLYEALPFTILWTSMAWHALISVTLGLWLFRRVMTRATPVQAVGFCAVSGVYLGIFAVELWSVPVDDAPWVWQPVQVFAMQMLWGWALFMAGHIAIDFSARQTVRPARWELPAFGGLSVLAYAAGPMFLLFPVSLVLPVLVVLAVWMIRCDGSAGAAPVLVQLVNWRPALTRYIASIAIPLGAIATYAALSAADLQLESSALHIIWAGPVALILTGWSAWQTVRPRETT